MPLTPARAFRRGARDALPLQLATFPFGVIFGALAREAGLDLLQTMAMTTAVTAGAAQITSVGLMREAAPALLAIAAGAVVNLRMLMYSASMAPHWADAPVRLRALAALLLHDQTYALSIARYRANPDDPARAKIGYYLGVGLLSLAVWVSGGLTGALIGAQVPESWGLAFAIPAVFIALTAPLLREPAHLAAAGTSVALALLFNSLPLRLGLVIAALGGVAAGALAETLLTRSARR